MDLKYNSVCLERPSACSAHWADVADLELSTRCRQSSGVWSIILTPISSTGPHRAVSGCGLGTGSSAKIQN